MARTGTDILNPIYHDEDAARAHLEHDTRIRPQVHKMDRDALMDADLIKAFFDLGIMGIEVPESAKTALETLVLGREIALWRLGSEDPSPASPKPLVSTTAALIPAAPASSMICGTVGAGVAITASSGGCGSFVSRG